jgi:N6-L-threonylcarbamoyladenine synthase
MVQLHESPQSTAIQFPTIALVASGGHTELFLLKSMTKWQWMGGTIDDAAGEAFDKTARLLGFQNQGGLAIQEAAKNHDPQRPKTITLPRPLIHEDTLNFSFSGLKTAVINAWKQHKADQNNPPNPLLTAEFAYEIQEAITDVLLIKTLQAAKNTGAVSILLSGGVAANSRLREKFSQSSKIERITVHYPPVQLCTDNAVVIGAYAYFHPKPINWQDISAIPNLSVEHQFPAATSLNSQ